MIFSSFCLTLSAGQFRPSAVVLSVFLVIFVILFCYFNGQPPKNKQEPLFGNRLCWFSKQTSSTERPATADRQWGKTGCQSGIFSHLFLRIKVFISPELELIIKTVERQNKMVLVDLSNFCQFWMKGVLNWERQKEKRRGVSTKTPWILHIPFC